MKRERIAALLCVLCLLCGSARADRVVRFENMHYGEEARSMHMNGETNELIFEGESYRLDDDCFSYQEAFPVYGGKTRAVYEMTIPKERFSADEGGEALLLGTAVIDIPYQAQLYICEGNRRSGEYTVSDPIALTDVYEEDIYLPRDEDGEPALVDKIYLYSYEVNGETRRFAASLYIDYEACSAGYASDSAVKAAGTAVAAETAAGSGFIAMAVGAGIVALAAAGLIWAGRRSKQKKAATGQKTEAEQSPSGPQTFSAKAEDILRRISAEGLLIRDEEIAERVARLEEICGRIFEAAAEQPGREAQARRFLSYYLPTTLKIITVYRTVSERGVSAAETETARRSGIKGLDMVLEACQKLLDNLYRGDILDISSDVSVLEQMLRQEGFLENEMSISGKVAKKG